MVFNYALNYDFKAEEDEEISAPKGTHVVSDESKESSEDGWLHISFASDSSKKGFVPVDYLNEVKQAGASKVESPLPAPRAPMPTPQPAKPQKSASPAVELKPNLPYASSQSAPAPLPTTDTIPPTRSSPSAANRNEPVGSLVPDEGTERKDARVDPMAIVEAINSNEFATVLDQHDNWVNGLKAKQKEAFGNLTRTIDLLDERVAACKEKNTAIVGQLTKLDNLIEEERLRWKQRLDAEAAAMNDRISKMYNLDLGAVTVESPSQE
eukprot:g3630.t1